jgi:hypothetical protein
MEYATDTALDHMAVMDENMEAEVKASFKWVVLAAVFGLVVLLTFYVMVVMAHADPCDIAVRIFSID